MLRLLSISQRYSFMSHAKEAEERNLPGSVILFVAFKGIQTPSFLQAKWEGQCFIIGQAQKVTVVWTLMLP